MVYWQILLLAGLAARWMMLVERAINGSGPLKPLGFWGVIAGTIVCMLVGVAYWQAGALSRIVP